LLPKAARAKDTPFDQWVAAFRAKAVARGITAETYAKAMDGIKPDTTELEAIHHQPEFTQKLWQYLNRVTSDWKIAAGKETATQYAPLLSRIEARFRHRAPPSPLYLDFWWLSSAAKASTRGQPKTGSFWHSIPPAPGMSCQSSSITSHPASCGPFLKSTW
jgi:hypothetical protein